MLQGEMLVSFLCIITIDYVIRQVIGENNYNINFKIIEIRKRNINGYNDLSYSDDITLISQELYQAQELLHIVEI